VEYRKLGKTDIDVSLLCLGCMGLVGDDQDEKDSIAAIHASLDAGVNFFDTARAYQRGRNEELLGRVLGSRRSEVVIATKLNGVMPEQIKTQCEESLQRLRTDYIDLYQVHWPEPGADLGAMLGALVKLQQEGKIRAIGVSNFGMSYMEELASLPGRVEANQLQYNLAWRPIEHEIQPFCVEHDVSILCYSPLNMGLLTGKFTCADEVPSERAQHRLFSSTRPNSCHTEAGCEDAVFRMLGQVDEIADSLGEPTGNVAMAWLAARTGVTSIIAGARTADQADQNAAFVDLNLPESILSELTAASDPIKAYAGRNADQWESVSRMEKPA
jgi:myo-inositol catabolism protein IolS